MLCQGILKLTPKHFDSILSTPLPKMRKQLWKFLGAMGCWHEQIPNFAGFAKPLFALLPDITLEPVIWTSEA